MELAGNHSGDHYGKRGGRGGGHHGAQPVGAPPGFYVFCGVVAAASAAVIAVNLARHPGQLVPRAAAPRPSASAPPSAAAPAPSGPSSGAASSVPAHSVVPATPGSRRPPPPTHRPSPSPHPSPAGPGLVQAGASLVVPLRGSTPVAVRITVVAPAAPPWPTLSLGLLAGLSRG